MCSSSGAAAAAVVVAVLLASSIFVGCGCVRAFAPVARAPAQTQPPTSGS